jgi:tripartite-type tricarboxylate transporter receptor subunit TctC
MALKRRMAVVFLACIAVAAAAVGVAAQDAYPTRRVRVVMPFPPGSGTDILARLVADRLSHKWGQPVVVDNMSGGGGNIGGETVARAAPDGYTLLFVPAPPLVINQFVYKKLGYDPAKFVPISMVASVDYALVVRKDFPASTVMELIDYAKANPGKINYASSSVGSTAHLAALQLQMMTGTQMQHVPYRGAAPALNDVMAGHVDMVFDIVSTASKVWDSHQVKILGTGGDKRSRIMPTIPTIAEAGLPGYQALTWFAMVGPPDMPIAIADKISSDTREVLNIDEVGQRIRDLGMDVAGLDPAASGKFFAEEAEHWGKIVKAAGISFD